MYPPRDLSALPDAWGELGPQEKLTKGNTMNMNGNSKIGMTGAEWFW
jgi:hypothetical protein